MTNSYQGGRFDFEESGDYSQNLINRVNTHYYQISTVTGISSSTSMRPRSTRREPVLLVANSNY